MNGKGGASPAGVPAELLAALAKAPQAKALFDKMPPSHRAEYTEYITEARRADTRQRRVAAVIAMILKWGEDRRAKRR